MQTRYNMFLDDYAFKLRLSTRICGAAKSIMVFFKSQNSLTASLLFKHLPPPVTFWNNFKNAYPSHRDLTKYPSAIYSNVTKRQLQITCCDYSSSGQNTCRNVFTGCNYIDHSDTE